MSHKTGNLIEWQSIQESLRYFNVDQRGGRGLSSAMSHANHRTLQKSLDHSVLVEPSHAESARRALHLPEILLATRLSAKNSTLTPALVYRGTL